MGANLSEPHSGGVADTTVSDSDPDWIVSHAMATQLAVPEVERLWLRFKQLGYGPDPGVAEHGILSDIFVRNILKEMKDDSGQMTFRSFLHVIKWFETASLDDKIRGIYHLLNNGKSLDQKVLEKTLTLIYPNTKGAEISKLAEVVIKQIGKKKKGHIDEAEFIEWSRSMDRNKIEKTLAFSILPFEINRDAQTRLSEFHASLVGTSQQYADELTPLTDAVLRTVASAIQHEDWQMIMKKLNFLEADIGQFQQSNVSDKVFAMLCEWRRREGRSANVKRLRAVLTDSGISPVL